MYHYSHTSYYLPNILLNFRIEHPFRPLSPMPIAFQYVGEFLYGTIFIVCDAKIL